MSEQRLREELDLPVVGGVLEAYVHDQLRQNPDTREFEPWYLWRLIFHFAAVDRRFNPGVASIEEFEFISFLGDARSAVERLNALKNRSFEGKYEQRYGPYLEVVSENGPTVLKVWAPSGTYRFARSLDPGEAATFADRLALVAARGDRLKQTLRKLNE